MNEIYQMPNLLDDNYQCIMGKYNLYQIVVFYGLTVIWARREAKRKDSGCRKGEICANVSAGRQ